MIIDLAAAFFMVVGALFMFLSAVGIVRLPDTYIRMHALTKAGTFGVIGVMLSTIIHFREVRVLGPALLVILFFLVTIPVAGHLLSRAAYFSGVPKWKNTGLDELAGHPDGEGNGGDGDGRGRVP
jgi:multicomponent Na+:H+ antiporter subunit G